MSDPYLPAVAPRFGDVEEAVITWLQAECAPVRIFDRIPKANSSLMPYVTVTRVGGPVVSPVTEEALLVIEAWAEDWATAQSTLQLARTALWGLPGHVVAGLTFARMAEFAGPARLPDPVSNFPRFTFTVSATVRSL